MRSDARISPLRLAAVVISAAVALAPQPALAVVDIQDPGKDAEGFEIDVCLRADQAVYCAADAATQAGAPQAQP